MSQFIAPAELNGLTEQELRALYARIMEDLARLGQSAQDCPHLYATLQNIEAAILRLKQAQFQHRPKPPRP